MSSLHELMGKRGRDRTFILAKICEVALDGATRTQIMYQTNLSFRNTIQYISVVRGLGLLEEVKVDVHHTFKTTEKGLRYLKSFKEIRNLLIHESTQKKVSPKKKLEREARRQDKPITLDMVYEQLDALNYISDEIAELRSKIDMVYAELQKKNSKRKRKNNNARG